MREKEAADFLSVAPRTLRRYRQQGLIPHRKVKGKTGLVVEYDRADLEQLKVKVLQRAKVPQEPRVPKMARVTFGLPPEDFAELSAEAKKYGLNPGMYARRLMREAMESRLQADIRDIRDRDEKNASEVKRLRRDVAAAFEAVLEHIGMDPEVAKDWVTENLR